MAIISNNAEISGVINRFHIAFGVEYCVTPCEAVTCVNGDTEPQKALFVWTVSDSGERFEYVVFGWNMPKTNAEFYDMCDDIAAWFSDCETLQTVTF